MRYLAMFKDPEGLPRAWGVAPTEEESIAIAQIELWEYKDKKARQCDPYGLATAAFTLVVAPLIEEEEAHAND